MNTKNSATPDTTTSNATEDEAIRRAACVANMNRVSEANRERTKESFQEAMRSVARWKAGRFASEDMLDDALHLLDEMFPDDRRPLTLQPQKPLLLGLILGVAICNELKPGVVLGADPASVLAAVTGEEERLDRIFAEMHDTEVRATAEMRAAQALNASK